MVIMNQYTELYAWIRHSFEGEAFTIDGFRSVFPTPQAPKVIHDLLQGGYLHRVSRGVYKAVEPGQLMGSVVGRGEGVRKVMASAQRKYAYCESTAVAVWTSGYYWTGFTKGFKPLHIKVLRKDLAYWRRFFDEHGVRNTLAGESRTLFGFVYVLHPAGGLESVDKDGEQVVPLEEAVQFCLKREMAYQPALEYLDQAYHIGYRGREFIGT